jgi:hypothetical protein
MFKKCENHLKTTNFKFIFTSKFMLVLIEKNLFESPSETYTKFKMPKKILFSFKIFVNNNPWIYSKNCF